MIGGTSSSTAAGGRERTQSRRASRNSSKLKAEYWFDRTYDRSAGRCRPKCRGMQSSYFLRSSPTAKVNSSSLGTLPLMAVAKASAALGLWLLPETYLGTGGGGRLSRKPISLSARLPLVSFLKSFREQTSPKLSSRDNSRPAFASTRELSSDGGSKQKKPSPR